MRAVAPEVQGLRRRLTIDRLRSAATPGRVRLGIALSMVVVSLVSAYITHLATGHGGEAGRLDGLAAQQSAEEQQAEQQIDSVVRHDQRLFAAYQRAFNEYAALTRRADAARGADPALAEELDFEAQVDFDQLRGLFGLFRAAQPTIVDGLPVYDAAEAERNLRMSDQRLFRALSGATRELGLRERALTMLFVLAVLLLVVSLFLLTMAHLLGDRAGILAPFGLLAAFVALLIVTFADPAGLWPAWIVLIVGGVVLALVARVRYIRSHNWFGTPPESEAANQLAEVPAGGVSAMKSVDPAARPDRFGTVLAIVIASSTLVGAVAGFLQANAGARGGAAAWEAQQLGVRAIGAQRTAEEQISVKVAGWTVAMEARMSSWGATQRAHQLRANGDPEAAADFETEAAELAVLSDALVEGSGLAGELGRGGAPERTALIEVWSAAAEPAARYAALQDAANANAAAWGERAGVLVSVFVFLGVGGYLLGLSLVFRRGSAGVLLAAAGTLMLVAGGVRTLSAVSQDDAVTRAAAEQAADEYAAGTVALAAEDFAAAEAAFTRALEHRPNFLLARRDRGTAIFFASAVQRSGLRSAFTLEGTQRAIADMEAVLAAGMETPVVLLQLGAMEFHRSILANRPESMTAAVEYTRRARAALAGDIPHVNTAIVQMNLALGLLGNDQPAEAETAYIAAGTLIRALPEIWHSELVGGAFTPLEILLRAKPDLAPTIAANKERLIGLVYGATERRVAAPSVEIDLFPASLQWRAAMPEFDRAQDEVFVAWYRSDPGSNAWYALPSISGPLQLGVISRAGVFNVAPDGTYFGRGTVLADVYPNCVDREGYRVELYVNGRLAGRGERIARALEHIPQVDRSVGVGLCAPASWSRSTGYGGRERLITTADGATGLAVFRVHQPRPVGLATPEAFAAAAARAIDQVVRDNEGLPAVGDEFSTLDPNTQATLLAQRASAAWREYSYDGGVMKIGAAFSNFANGNVIVVAVFGPRELVDSEVSGNIIASIDDY